MLVAAPRFVEHFPQQEGFTYFRIDAPKDAQAGDQEALLSETLEAGLAPYGFDAMPTRDKLAAFHAVQNTYLSTFRTLGGLGLLLGTLGLAVVLLRNVIERRSELAAMRAFGFRRRWLIRLVVVENAVLLLCGLALGTVAALVTVLPQLLAEGAHVPWTSIASTLGIILIVGLAMCTAMASGALRTPLLEALKAER
jgi:ABC-type antimicrobial peptide transport system permease subunit